MIALVNRYYAEARELAYRDPAFVDAMQTGTLTPAAEAAIASALNDVLERAKARFLENPQAAARLAFPWAYATVQARAAYESAAAALEGKS